MIVYVCNLLLKYFTSNVRSTRLMYILSEMAIRLMIEATVDLVILQTDHVLFQWYHPGTVLELDVNMCIVRRTIFLCYFFVWRQGHLTFGWPS